MTDASDTAPSDSGAFDDGLKLGGEDGMGPRDVDWGQDFFQGAPDLIRLRVECGADEGDLTGSASNCPPFVEADDE